MSEEWRTLYLVRLPLFWLLCPGSRKGATFAGYQLNHPRMNCTCSQQNTLLTSGDTGPGPLQNDCTDSLWPHFKSKEKRKILLLLYTPCSFLQCNDENDVEHISAANTAIVNDDCVFWLKLSAAPPSLCEHALLHIFVCLLSTHLRIILDFSKSSEPACIMMSNLQLLSCRRMAIFVFFCVTFVWPHLINNDQKTNAFEKLLCLQNTKVFY